jgi:hypothetical protein
VVKTCGRSGMSCPDRRYSISTVHGVAVVGSPAAFNIALRLFLIFFFRLIACFVCYYYLFSTITGPLG